MCKLVSKTILLLTILSQLTGCATMWNGTRQKVEITSIPSGADVFVENYYVGKTPLEVKFKRKHAHNIWIVNEGYEPEAIRLESTFDPKLTINAIPAICYGTAYGVLYYVYATMASVSVNPVPVGLTAAGVGLGVCCAVDCVTGGAYKLSSDQVHVDMKPVP